MLILLCIYILVRWPRVHNITYLFIYEVITYLLYYSYIYLKEQPLCGSTSTKTESKRRPKVPSEELNPGQENYCKACEEKTRVLLLFCVHI